MAEQRNGQRNTTRLPEPWSIVLAGGEGVRLAPMISQWLGQALPKQFCTFTGTRSMLQHTVDRADCLSHPDRRVTVVSAHHAEEARRQLHGRGGRLVVQPLNRDTAPGMYLPLTYVRATDPNAMVVIYPSDHFVYPEQEFIAALRHAVLAAELMSDRPVLLGIRPDRREVDYGHIRLDRRLGVYGTHSLWTVGQLIERPGVQAAQVLRGRDLLWNTMVMVAKVAQLWKMGSKILPSMIRLFETFQPAIDSPKEDRVLSSLYERMPNRNFSTDILEHHAHRIAAFDLHGVQWNDWGRPERMMESLREIGKTPTFPSGLVGVA